MADTRLRVGIAGDDEAHALLARWLADRATREWIGSRALSWPDPDLLEEARVWVGLDPDETFFSTTRTSERLRKLIAPSGRPFFRNPRVHGAPGIEARVVADTILLFGFPSPRVDVLLVLVDEDADRKRVAAVQAVVDDHRARAEGQKPAMLVLAAVTAPIAEAWLVGLIGLEKHHVRKSFEKAEKLDPALEPHLLTALPLTAPRQAKRVLAFFLDEGRKQLLAYPSTTPGITSTRPALEAANPHNHWPATWEACGLAAFYRELLARYAPRICGA